jgi:hypothetical protein
LGGDADEDALSSDEDDEDAEDEELDDVDVEGEANDNSSIPDGGDRYAASEVSAADFANDKPGWS